MTIFDEKYRVVAVESDCLIIKGVMSGNVFAIKTEPDCVLSEGAFLPGKLLVLSDPSTTAAD
jgi:hypothetical protein